MARDAVDHRPDLRLALVMAPVVMGAPAALGGWAWSVRERLPDPVARHWGAGGQADGFSSLPSVLTVHVVLAVLLTLPIGLVAVLGRQPLLVRRLLAGVATWLSVFLTALVADSLVGQLDLADAADAPAPGIGIGVGALGGLVLAVAVAATARERPGVARASKPPPPQATRLATADAEPTWRCSPVGLDTTAAVVTGHVTVLLVVMAAVLSWWLLAIAVPVAALCGGMGRVRATVDGDGLTARVLGVPLLRVPIEEVAQADVVEVDPFWEFGGWGLRVDAAGRVGLVTRTGEALRVRRGDDSEVLVTVRGAEEAAATLNTLADRRAAGERA